MMIGFDIADQILDGIHKAIYIYIYILIHIYYICTYM